jgi:hypothetical protein
MRALAPLPAGAGPAPGVLLAAVDVRSAAARVAIGTELRSAGARVLARVAAELERVQRAGLTGELLTLAAVGARARRAVAADELLLEHALALLEARSPVRVRLVDAAPDHDATRTPRSAARDEERHDGHAEQHGQHRPGPGSGAAPRNIERAACVRMPWMNRLAVLALALALALGGGVARAAMHGGGGGAHGGGGHGGWHGGGHGWGGHGFHHGPHVFIDGGFFFGVPFYSGYDPFYPSPYDYYPYPPAYAYPYPAVPPDDEAAAQGAPSGEQQDAAGPSGPTEQASYGLIRLRGVPDDASVDLDGRLWLTADRLDQRWMALPEGPHTLTVRAPDGEPRTKRIEVTPGSTQVVDFGSHR